MSIDQVNASESVIDSRGYRANVGIILSDAGGRLLWARRAGKNGWPVPQGGLQPQERPGEALFRGLAEENGRGAGQVGILCNTEGWGDYHLPGRFRRGRGAH